VEYLVGWWDTPLDNTTEARWVFEDLKGNEISTGACEPTHWCRIERPRDGAYPCSFTPVVSKHGYTEDQVKHHETTLLDQSRARGIN
jgi:hypothetical protein